MPINKNHPNYSKSPALKGVVVHEAKGPNREALRRNARYVHANPWYSRKQERAITRAMEARLILEKLTTKPA